MITPQILERIQRTDGGTSTLWHTTSNGIENPDTPTELLILIDIENETLTYQGITYDYITSTPTEHSIPSHCFFITEHENNNAMSQRRLLEKQELLVRKQFRHQQPRIPPADL